MAQLISKSKALWLKSTVWLKDKQERKDLKAEIAKKVVQHGHNHLIYNSDEFGQSFVFKIKKTN